MELRKGNILIELVHEGEGWSGDYDLEDPEDEPLLRFTAFLVLDDDYVQLEDASYCTRLSDKINDEIKTKALELLMHWIYEPAVDGYSIKKLCEELSWIGPDWFEDGVEPIMPIESLMCINSR